MRILLLIIVFVGSALRFTNLNWDSYQAFHPDERNISWAVTRIHFFDQLNPKFFAYGGLPIYLYRALGEIIVFITKDTNWVYDWGHIAVIGRYVSAILSSISILLIYVVGSFYFSHAAGLASAALLAFSPWAIREAHFATTETMLVFLLLLLLLLVHKYLVNPLSRSVIAQGFVLGLAIAAKTMSLMFALIPTAGIIIPLTQRQRPLLKSQSLKKATFSLIVLATTTLVVFFLFSPYTILDWQHFKESMGYETGVALGRFPVPYTYQFVNTIPYLYQIKTMVWQAGPTAIAGLIGLLFLIKKKPLFVVFPIVYFLWQGSWYAKFARYNVPLLPFLTISAAWFILSLPKKFRFLGLSFILIAFLWGIMNWTIYLRPQTRIEASKWIIKNIPADATIYTEHWNDGLPVFLPGNPVISYKRELLNVYDADTDEKKKMITKQLKQGDYIILSTRRIWGTMPKLTDRYPFTGEFYRKLLSGESDYKEVATFTSYPKLFGITINDDAAEESIQVFDHPTVRIFKKSVP